MRLLERFQQRLNVSQPASLVEALYRSDMDRRRIADLALVVLDAAQEGDAAALQLVATGAKDLAPMVTVLCDKLLLPKGGLPLALAGSFLLKSPLVRERLLYELCSLRGFQLRVTDVPDPVLGAVTLASRWLVA